MSPVRGAGRLPRACGRGPGVHDVWRGHADEAAAMKQKPSVDDFQKLIEQLAELLTKDIRKGLREEKKEGRLEHCRWKSAFLDARWISDGDGLGWKYKLRIALADGKW